MNTQQRVFLFIALFMMAFAALQYYRVNQARQQAEQQAAEGGPEQPAVVREGSTRDRPPVTPAPGETPTPAPVVDVPVEQQAQPLVTTTLEGPLFDVEVSNQGAVLSSMALTEYVRDAGTDVPVNLLNRTRDDAMPGFLGLAFEGNDALTREVREGRFVPRFEGPETRSLDTNTTLRYVYMTSVGVEIEKRYAFRPHSYAIDVLYNFRNVNAQPIILRDASVVVGNTFGLSPTEMFDRNISSASRFAHYGPFITGEDGVTKETFDDDPLVTIPMSGPMTWAGLDTPYFLAAIRDDSPKATSTVRFLKQAERAYGFWPLGDVDILPNASRSYRLRVYLGPKEHERLHAMGGNLSKALDLGWFDFLGLPLLYALNWLYGFVLNYGLAIIILTLAVRGVLLIFTYRSMISMQKMAALQPKIEEIKKQYKDDAEKRNLAIMQLYKDENVSVMGGCLPMLLQIPIFIALYNVLFNAIELRHAPFVLWIQDLSAEDPWKVLPILMGVSMYFQQSLTTPTGGDGPQASQMKMMRVVMPPFLTFISWTFPAGLVLYWTTSNVFGIVQQFIFIKLGIVQRPPASSSQPGSGGSSKKKKKKRRK